jgi:hypothetical protein
VCCVACGRFLGRLIQIAATAEPISVSARRCSGQAMFIIRNRIQQDELLQEADI